MSESIWKKEIHLGRRPRGETPPQQAEEPKRHRRAKREKQPQSLPAEASASKSGRRLFGNRRQPLPPLAPSVLQRLAEARTPRTTMAAAVVKADAGSKPASEWEVRKRAELWVGEDPAASESAGQAAAHSIASAAPIVPDTASSYWSATQDVLPSGDRATAPIQSLDPAPSVESPTDAASPHTTQGAGERADPAPEATPEQSVVPKPPLLRRELHLPRRSRGSSDSHPVRRIVGLRVGSSHLSAAHVRNNGSAELIQVARTPLERGLVVNGEVREPVALAKALKEFFASNKLPRKDVRLGIASNRIGVRVLEVPAIEDPKQFENALRFRAQEVLPIQVADAVLDHVVLEERTADSGEPMRRVLLVFAHRDLIARYVDVCRSAGVRLTGIDLDAFALLRAVSERRLETVQPTSAVVAVAVGHDRTVFAVSDGRTCDFTRVLEWGSSSLDVALARALDLTPSQAEPIKHALSLDTDEPPEGVTPLQFEAAREAAKLEIAVLARELMSSLRFYQSRTGSLDIGELLLAGGGAELGGFAAELQQALGVPVRPADPFARISVARKLRVPAAGGSLAIAVGLGIEA
ncbi:MAG TPA: type IV pilus assembly protein PilM [Gaiellaceae bacterium]